MKKRFIIEKESTTNTSSYDDTSSSFQTDTISDEYYTEIDNNGYPFLNIAKTKYRKPTNGSKQDLFTKDEIIKRLENTIPLKSMEEKKILTKLPYYKTWVRYYNTKTKKFRIGGHLMKVVYPDYVVLVNLNNKISWTVQLKDCIFYITDPRLKQDETNSIINTNKKLNNYNIKNDKKDNMEDKIKDKLYSLYKQGKLSRLE